MEEILAMTPLGWGKTTGVLGVLFPSKFDPSWQISKWFFFFWRSVRSVGVVIHQIRDRSWVSRWLKLEIPHTSECFVIESWRKSATQKCPRLEGICDRSQESFSGSLLWQVLWEYILELYFIHLYTLVTWCVSSCIIFRSGFNNISGLSWERCWNKCRRSGCTGFDGRRLGE